MRQSSHRIAVTTLALILVSAGCAGSATGIAQSLDFTADDRSLQVMPLFHIHGLLAGLLAPLSAGGSVACTEGFDAFRFFAQLEALRPTYYTAVPTMHQMVISRSSRHRDTARGAGLRFVRSSSASLPEPVLIELGELFGSPVIEAYGMTEATHQMCANPLPPAVAKPRSVGVPTGIELAVLDSRNQRMPAGERGEVSIKGPTVIDGYESNPEANAAAFTDGWFRTGDEGYVDGDGYLFLTGRLKEQINRGGEKVSPLEVDEALLRHPSVAQAVTFAMPHPKLGEEVVQCRSPSIRRVRIGLSPGATVESESDASACRTSVQIHWDADAGDSVLSEMFGYGEGTSLRRLRDGGWRLESDSAFGEEVSGEGHFYVAMMEESGVSSPTMTLSISLPGRPFQYDADEVSGGLRGEISLVGSGDAYGVSTFKWDINLLDPGPGIFAETTPDTSSPSWAWIVVVAAVAGLLILALLPWWLPRLRGIARTRLSPADDGQPDSLDGDGVREPPAS